jgi:signal transduction histidine kinase
MSSTRPTLPPSGDLGSRDPARVWSLLERVVRDGIVLVGPDGRVEYANDLARQLLSEDEAESEALVAGILARLPGDDRASRRVEIESAGETRVLLVEPSELADEEGARRLLIFRDARAVEALEEDLYLANRMRGLGELYASMAHDLKTPINAMTLLLDALRDSLVESPRGGDEESRQLEFVDTVRDELIRFHRSIQTFLSQTSPPSDARRRFDLRRLAREVARFAKPLAESRDVRLRLDLTEPATTLGYRDRLRQALLNIVVNGVEATPSGGEVRLVVRPMKGWNRVRVLDDGPGIDPARAERLFRMHYTTKPRGSGIGLFVARAAILAHGGSLRLRNRPEGGAEAEIRLPSGGAKAVNG